MITQMMKLADIKPYAGNAKKHPETQIKNVMQSIKDFGIVQPLVVDKDNILIIGHCRLIACKRLKIKEAPVVRLEDLTEEQANKLRLLDNKLNESEWDFDLLSDQIPELDFSAYDIDWGLELDNGEDDADVQEDEAPEQVETRCKLGDIWQLGAHRLICGDSTDVGVIDRLMDGGKADLVFTDPPYGMKKESEGVLNDNLNYDDLLDFNRQWIPLTFGALKDNGSWYCWGIDEPLMDIYSNILKPMQKENKITFRNLITWKKENDNPTMLFNGACSSNNRSYYTNEKCLFVMCGVQGFNNNSDHYDETFEPIRSYMEQEARKVNLSAKQLKEICGVGMYAHWFTKSQFGIIPKEHYEKLKAFYNGKAFTMEYDDLRNLFDDETHKTLKDAIMAKRAYFDGTADQCIDVWVHDVTSQKERKLTGGHATPKPIALCARAIKSSSREGEIVLDVFGGSGSTLIACEQLGRKCYMCELDPHYCDVIIQRWENLTNGKAVLLNGE